MDKSSYVRFGLDTKDHQIIQELVYYAESRFKKILMAMDRLSKGDEIHYNWMQSNLRMELVRTGL